ncbi:hypothetical protein HMPREF9446_01852 [Bacteroides fluxus YIT 12057]|uniref:Uncharacterized protein n=1 Tax=Bacteroides fluxus YIT 12057 TaxID=763034 RepID=F3PSY6_9BACE|nr:hypothetical protein HMPREF9446_01852 [Bacteroides fluxus YIT 12057]
MTEFSYNAFLSKRGRKKIKEMEDFSVLIMRQYIFLLLNWKKC